MNVAGDGGAADGPSGCLGSLGRGSFVTEADQAALRARVRQLLKEKFDYPDIYLADGNSMFEDWYESVSQGRSVLCEDVGLALRS